MHFNNSNENLSATDRYQQFVEAHIEAANEVFPKREPRGRIPISEHQAVVEARKSRPKIGYRLLTGKMS